MNEPTPSVAAIIANPHSTKEQAYQLGYDAGKIDGIIESHEAINKIFGERFAKPSEKPL